MGWHRGGWINKFHPRPHMAHPAPLLLQDTGEVGTPEPSSGRGAASPSPPHTSQQDHASPACPHQRACCSPQCRVCCTTENFKHQGNMTFWKGEILIRHLSLIIPPCQKCTVIYHPEQVWGQHGAMPLKSIKTDARLYFHSHSPGIS